ncbi:alpha-amylase family glycosyl hydrolase [Ornatilinea apprima]|uniref:alpha-amylase family glycosyl hydrolase n=1 Tax=Ornatilinea apprima TaxID=1134406 RepID=UPI00191BE2F5|nr:alpha-amylase family glycosyl hydrolase [Ornatilinea apprima]
MEKLLQSLAQSWFARPADLKQLDLSRESNPDWFQSNQMVGGVCYVDLFAGSLEGIQSKIPYFRELGLTYLHLMPLFKSPDGENDGGYAISSYREINPSIGTMKQLAQLSRQLRENGVSLVLDFVFNHTSNEHQWALNAIAGDPEYQDYYFMFPDRVMPDAYERNLREIFPEQRPGSFTYLPEVKKWVWTTFNSYQWDLNYQNPAVFIRMAEEMLSLANAGVEVLRMDAVAFTWKEMGTVCENLPKAHILIQAYNAVARIAAPALLFKSEAIVHPDEVVRYISPAECQLSYNPLIMALLWNTLATREINLLKQALVERFSLPEHTAWVNYVRCHDDIGWTFSDDDAGRLGINGYDHRKFLNAFYTGRYPESFARGLPFQENPRTGDARISGTCASLAGLEKALTENSEEEIQNSINRILLLHRVIMTIGGIPLIYLGDEIGTLNDYSYRNDPAKASDSRWVHRPRADWSKYENRNNPGSVEYRIFQEMQKFIRIRKTEPALANGHIQVMDTWNPHVLGYVRSTAKERLIILANFSEKPQELDFNLLRLYGLGYTFENLITKENLNLEQLRLTPYQFLILRA